MNLFVRDIYVFLFPPFFFFLGAQYVFGLLILM